MINLVDFLSGDAAESSQSLDELRLGPEPVMVIPFTKDIEVAKLHYETDDSARGFIVCPGERCPACHLGNQPTTTGLLPLYSIEHQEVRVLRVPQKRSPGSLATHLLPLIASDDAGDKMLLIRRDGAKYTAESRPLGEHADRGEAVIQDFIDVSRDQLPLSSAFVRMTADEYADVPRVRLKLEARGDYPLPG